MDILFSLLGSSIDGLICGFLIVTLGIKLSKKNYLNFFIIISGICFVTSFAGSVIKQFTDIELYTNIVGAALMLWLSYGAFKSCNESETLDTDFNVNLLALALAIDSGVVSMYLGLCDFKPSLIALYNGILHCALIFIGTHIASSVTEEKLQKRTKLLSAFIFLLLGLSKLYKVLIIRIV